MIELRLVARAIGFAAAIVSGVLGTLLLCAVRHPIRTPLYALVGLWLVLR